MDVGSLTSKASWQSHASSRRARTAYDRTGAKVEASLERLVDSQGFLDDTLGARYALDAPPSVTPALRQPADDSEPGADQGLPPRPPAS